MVARRRHRGCGDPRLIEAEAPKIVRVQGTLDHDGFLGCGGEQDDLIGIVGPRGGDRQGLREGDQVFRILDDVVAESLEPEPSFGEFDIERQSQDPLVKRRVAGPGVGGKALMFGAHTKGSSNRA